MDEEFIKARIRLPTVDHYAAPQEKMPDCPICRKDALGMVTDDEAFCYNCSVFIGRRT